MALAEYLKYFAVLIWGIHVCGVSTPKPSELRIFPVWRETIMIHHCSEKYSCFDACDPSHKSSCCSCHPACEIFRDCCYNTLEQTRNCSNANATENFMSVLVGVRDYFSCVTDEISNSKYWMISSCPEYWGRSNECDVNDTDLFVGRLEDNFSGVPVLSNNGLTYRNIYCALCHGENISALTPWTFDANDCEDNAKSENLTTLSTKDLIRLLRENCQRLSFLPPRDHQFYSLSVIPCHEVREDVIDECKDNTTSINAQLQCATIAAPFEIDGNLYKNRYCAECFYSLSAHVQYWFEEICQPIIYDSIGFSDVAIDLTPLCAFDYVTGEKYCPPNPTPPPPPPLVPISITFNFGGQSGDVSVVKSDKLVKKNAVTCEVGQVSDPLSNKCKRLSCPDGFFLRDSLCKPLPNPERNDSVKCGLLVTTFKYEGITFGNKSCLEYTDVIVSCLPVELMTLFHAIMRSYNVSCNITTDGQVRLETEMSSLDIVGRLVTKTASEDIIYSEDCNNIDMVEMSAYCASTSYDQLFRCDSEWLNETQWSRSGNVSEGIVLKNSSELIDISQIKIRHFFRLSPTVGRLSSDNVLINRCELIYNNVSTCPTIILDSALFIPWENDSSVLLFAANTSMQFTSDMYTQLENGSIKICYFLTSVGNKIQFMSFARYSNIQTILSTVGIILSLLALLITLTSYCMFPSLRTRLANIVIMTLCGCLIMAQLLLLFAGIATTNPVICSLVSGLGHFFWLAAFSSSSVLGYLMNQTFSLRSQTLRVSKPSKKSKYFISVSCFVFPALISGTLLILYCVDVDDLHGIAYGSLSGCWIGGPIVNLYAFGIPVAVSLIINLIFFIHVTVSICIQKRRSKDMRKSHEDSYVRELVIYAKIFIVLGLTWISGFVAAIFNQSWMWYLFIIFTSLQGVFVFLAFSVKSQIWVMWRKRLGLYIRTHTSSSQGVSYRSGRQITSTSRGTTTTTAV